MAANVTSDQTPSEVIENWEEVLQGSDKAAFEEIVAPYMNVLLDAARRELGFYQEMGYIHDDDFTPEELTGETLINAWQHRGGRPKQMGLRSWLLAIQYRTAKVLVNRQRAYRRDQSVSLDEPVPTDEDGDSIQEWFWEWYQPDVELTWEDVIPAQEPQDVEIPLDGDREGILRQAAERRVLMLHDEFEMSLPEVALTLNRTPVAVAEILEQARVSMSKRETEDSGEEIEHPNPEE